jgi:hypothetical protein
MQVTAEQKAKLEQQGKAKTKRTRASKSLALTSTRTELTTALTSSQKALTEAQDGMDQFSEDFSDRLAEIVEDGITSAYQKSAEKIAEIELPDFFGSQEGDSMFKLSSYPTQNVLEGTSEALEVEVVI